MNRLRGLSLGARLALGYLVILAMMTFIAVFSAHQVTRIDSSLDTVNNVNSVKQRYAINLRGSVHDRAIALRDYTLVSTPQTRKLVSDDIGRLADAYSKSAAGLDEMFAAPDGASAEERAILAGIKETEARTLTLMKDVMRLQEAGLFDAANEALMRDARLAFNDWLARINKFIDFQEARSKEIGAEAADTADRFPLLMLLMCALSLAVGIGFACWNFLAIRPLRPLTQATLRLADGHLETEIPDVANRDEIGDIVRAVRVFKDNALRGRDELLERQAEQEAKLKRGEFMAAATQSFEKAVTGIATELSSAVTNLNATAQSMSGTAARTAGQSENATASARVAGENVTLVAAAAEELGATIREIGRQVEGAADLTRSAVDEANQTASLVAELSNAAEEIGKVVALIQGIASQTNLLALNATIEAARAGDAGKGFAVVASEVKELANQTSRATGEIGTRIATIQSSTSNAVSAITSISNRVSEISGVTGAIAAAVTQQGAATEEIVANITQAATKTQDVAAHIAGVAEAADQTGAAAGQVIGSASLLERQSADLDLQVREFIAAVRSA